MNDGLKASGPSRQRGQYIVAKPLSKNAAAAKNGVAPETTDHHPQDNSSASDRQIGGLSQISALGSTGTGPTARTRCRKRCGAHVKKYTIRADFGMFDDQSRRRQSRRPKSPFHRADSLSKIARHHPSHAARLSLTPYSMPIHTQCQRGLAAGSETLSSGSDRGDRKRPDARVLGAGASTMAPAVCLI